MSLHGKMDAIHNLGGNEALYYKHLERFTSNYRNCVDVLGKLTGNREYEEAYRYIHSVKGLASLLGLPYLQMQAESVELAIKEGRYLDLPSLLYSLQLVLNDTLQSKSVQSSASVGA